MNERKMIATINEITLGVLNHYRDAIPRKAFVEAMTRVKTALLVGATKEGGEQT